MQSTGPWRHTKIHQWLECTGEIDAGDSNTRQSQGTWSFSGCRQVCFTLWSQSYTFLSFFFFFNLFRATPEVYGGSQARSQIEAIAASLHHSHSNSATYTAAHSKAESLSKARNWPGILVDPSWFHYHLAMMGTLQSYTFLMLKLIIIAKTCSVLYSVSGTVWCFTHNNLRNLWQ